jgi:hypothetical protein
MLEQQRIEYLQAMGIQLWMPRQALDNAAEPSWLADTGASNAPPEAVSDGTRIKAGHAADLLADIGLVDAKPEFQTKAKAHSSESHTSATAPYVPSPIESSSEVADAAKLDEVTPAVIDLTIPNFELYFALWPCGILWVASKPFERTDHTFQTAVSYFLLGNAVPQANYSQFKWPYIEGSNEDQTMSVALRALTAQWEFMSGQGARGWIAMDGSSLEWLAKVASKPLFSISGPSELYCAAGKKQLWQVLQKLSTTTVS